MRPLVIFEIANNHMGDVNHGKKIISEYCSISRVFKNEMDFAFKFQFRDLDSYVHHSYKDIKNSQVERFISTKLSERNWHELIAICRKKKFKIIGTAFDEKSVDKIISLKLDYLKIASCSVDEWPLLEYIAKKIKNGKILSSLGGASEAQIRNSVSFFVNRRKNIKFLYCVAKYPTHPHDLNLKYFSHLQSIYGEKILGFSSHEYPSEILSGGLSYALGARIFEKHVNINSKKYKINKYSTNLHQMSLWLENLYETIKRIGSVEKRENFLKYERQNLKVFKRGAYLKKGIEKKRGEKILINDIDFAFPCEKKQLEANVFSKFSNFIAKNNLKGGQKILSNKVKIANSRNKIEIIRDKVNNLILKSKVVITKQSRIEISHHRGVQNFEKYGLCMITILNSRYCKKLLFIFKNQNHPPQFHKIKQETFFILYGRVKLVINKNNKKNVKILNTGDIVTIYPGEIHSFKGLSKDGAVIEELSTRSNSKDSFYLDKKITNNKNRKSFISLK